METVTLTPAFDALVSVTLGGRKVYYTTSNGGMFSAARGDRQSAFEAGQPLQTADDSEGGFGAYVVDTDDLVYYPRRAGAGTELVTARLLSTGFSGPGERVRDVSVAGGEDWDPVLNGAQTSLFFVSGGDIPGVPVFVTRRRTRAEAFSGRTRVPELEDAANDHVSWVSEDECVVYLTRSSHIFMATRPR